MRPAKKHGKRPTDIDPETISETAIIAAEEIEAGYDAQADAASRSLADDPASSSEADEDKKKE